MSPFDPDTTIGGRRGKFPSTRQTLIDRVQSSDGGVRAQALEEVIAVYWKPLYKYVRLRWHKSNEEAKDLTQSFLTNVIEQEALGGFDAGRGTFRTWLRTLIDRHVTDDLRSSGRIKRGGGLEELDFAGAEVELSEQQSGADSSPDELLRRNGYAAFSSVRFARSRQSSKQPESISTSHCSGSTIWRGPPGAIAIWPRSSRSRRHP